MKPVQSIILIILLFALSSRVNAQSDNYWSWNFNTKSTLLGGAVVGGNAGPSSVFFNPALIDHDKSSSLSMSANVVSLQFFNVDNIAGDGIDVDRILFKIQPRLISYVLPNKREDLRTEVAILTPVSEEIQYTTQHSDEIDIIERTQGNEMYSGYIKYSRKYVDTWVGGGFSYQVSDNLYIGTSYFLSIKTLKYQYRQIANAQHLSDTVQVNNVPEPRYIAENSFEEEFKYWFLSLIFKAGAYYEFPEKRFSIGANVTLPDLPIYGEADVRKSFTRSNIYNNDDDVFVSNKKSIGVEENIRGVRAKNPFSISVGGQYQSKNFKNL